MKKLALFAMVSVIVLWSLSSMQDTPILVASRPQRSFDEYDFEPSSVPPDAEWNKTYGGFDSERAESMIQTSDGGYALAGCTRVGEWNDFWLVKTDWAGNEQWNKTYGGTDADYAWSVVQTDDGGYALAGYTWSFDAGGGDFWLVKTDSAGNEQWSKTYGGFAGEIAWSVVQTDDGGYALAGGTWSFDGDEDFWLVKTDWAGNEQWNKTYQTPGDQGARSVVQTSDGGYALAGGGYDFWLVRTDSAGTMQWNKTYDSPAGERHEPWSLIQTSDGGYALAGEIVYSGGGTASRLVKTDSAGTMQWSKTYSGQTYSEAYSVVQTADGGYAIAGRTSTDGIGAFDLWLVKVDSGGEVQWRGAYGGEYQEGAYSVVETSDEGYTLAGYTDSYGAGGEDFWLIKLAPPTYALAIAATIGGTTSPAPGTHTYSPGTVISVTAIPNTGFYFDHWELDDIYQTINPITITMEADHNLHAFFVYDVTIDAYCYTEGTPVAVNIKMDGITTGFNTPHTFTALSGTHNFTIPDADSNGHPFKQWSTGEMSTTITVSSGGTCTAYYQAKYTLTIMTTTGGTTSPIPGTYTYWDGTVVSVKAIPNTGSTFDHWELDGIFNTTNPISVTMDIDHTLHAVFVYDVTIKAYCYTEGKYLSVSITMDGTPTGFNTSHTFAGLIGTHNFTVPDTDPNGRTFIYWNTGDTSATITVSSGGTYRAYYESPVGGVAFSVDKLALLAPYIGLASTIVVATVATAIYVKRVKRRREKQ